jgi:hypothetical protein
MPYPLPLTRTEAYLAYKAGVIQQADLKPSLAIPRNGIDAWLAYWTGLTTNYPVKNVGKNLFDKTMQITDGYTYASDGTLAVVQTCSVQEAYIQVKPNSTYTLHTDATSSQTTNFRVYICEYTASKAFIKRDIPNPVTSNTNTITTTANTHFVRLCFSTIGIDTLQFEAGSNATAYESYTGEPLILQEEEAYIAYLCGVTDTYPEKCLRRVGAYLRYLISARWGRPEHPLNREELYLSLIKTQFIPSGNPSSDIEIDGTAKAAFVDVKMYGDTAQQTYTGKNILQLDGNSDNGLTGIVNADGSLTIRGTAMASRGLKVFTTTQHFSAGTYTLSISKSISSVVNLTLASSIGFRIPVGDTSVTTTLEQEYGGGSLFFAAVSGQEYDITFKAQLVTGSTPDYDFEPYVGEKPSPSPEYPQPIQTVTGLQKVEVRGKNLFDKATVSSNYWLLQDGSIQAHADYSTSDFIPVTAGEQYCLPATKTRRLKYYNSSKVALTNDWDIASGQDPQVITVPAGASYVKITIDYRSVDINSFQFEKGSTPTSYEPYSLNDYEINLGKNLLEFGFEGDSIDNITTSYDGSEITLNGKKTGQGNIHDTSNTATVLPAGTYTVSSRRLSGSADNDRIRLIVRFGNMAFTTRTNISSSASSYTFTLDSAQVVSFQIWSDGTCTCDNLKIGFMIEAGSQATAYVQFFEPIELCKFGAYQDYIWKDGEEWKIHKATGKYVFNGEEAWAWDDARIPRLYLTSGGLANLGIHAGIPPNSETLPIGKTNKFSAKTFKSFYTDSGGNGFAMSTTGQNFQIGDNSWTSESSAKDDVAGLEWVYVLATGYETDTAISNQALIDQLEALSEGGSEEGTTYIKVSATDSNLPGLLYVEAPKYE